MKKGSWSVREEAMSSKVKKKKIMAIDFEQQLVAQHKGHSPRTETFPHRNEKENLKLEQKYFQNLSFLYYLPIGWMADTNIQSSSNSTQANISLETKSSRILPLTYATKYDVT